LRKNNFPKKNVIALHKRELDLDCVNKLLVRRAASKSVISLLSSSIGKTISLNIIIMKTKNGIAAILFPVNRNAGDGDRQSAPLKLNVLF
jgi:hypothetical protein